MQMKYHAPIVAIILGLLVGFGFIAIPAADSDAKPAKEPNQRGKGKKSKPASRPAYGFPETAYEYAKMVEPQLGVPPRVDLGKSVEIPLYVNGVQAYGNLGHSCDNPTFLGKDSISGSTLQRYEGKTADGKPLPDVVWVSFGRNSSYSQKYVVGSVQMIGYNKKTGATAFFESSDNVRPWVTLDKGTLRMRGVMPWIDAPKEFNRAFVTPGKVQCVQCHQNDPFITNEFIKAAKMPGTNKPVVPILDEDSPYYVIGGEDWDMRTMHIEGNSCFECHRVGMGTLTLFIKNGWKPNEHMPPRKPGSLAEDLRELLAAWKEGPDKASGAEWIIPPARGKDRQVVGTDYPHKADFNPPYAGKSKFATFPFKDEKGKGGKGGRSEEVERLLGKLGDPGLRKAFEDWINENGLDDDTFEKLRRMAEGEK